MTWPNIGDVAVLDIGPAESQEAGIDYVTSGFVGVRNWTDPTAWTPNGVPGEFDTEIITEHIEIPTGVSVTTGHAPGTADAKKAIKVTNAGSLRMRANSTLKCRGDFESAADFIQEEGTVFEFDYSATTSPSTVHYKANLHNASISIVTWVVNGTAVNPCEIRKSAGGGYWHVPTASQNMENNSDLNHCTISGAGEGAVAAWEGRGNNANDSFLFDNVIWDGCAQFRNVLLANAATDYSFTNTTWKNSTSSGTAAQTSNINISTLVVATGLRLLQNCVFDTKLIYNGGFTFTTENVVLLNGTTFGGVIGEWTSFTKVAVYSEDQVPLYIQGDISDVFIQHSAGANPNLLAVRDAASWTVRNIVDVILACSNSSGGDADGIAPVAPSVATTFDLSRILVIPRPNGLSSCGPVSLQGTVNVTFNMENFTFYTEGEMGSIKAGETYSGHSGFMPKIDNHYSIPSDATGCVMHDSGADDLAADSITNARNNFTSIAVTDAYLAAALSFANTPGTGDEVQAPNFVAPSRNLLTFGTDILGLTTPTEAEVFDELALMNEPGFNPLATVQNLLDYLREGHRPQNEACRGAGVDGSDIGAVPMAPLGIGPIAYHHRQRNQ